MLDTQPDTVIRDAYGFAGGATPVHDDDVIDPTVGKVLIERTTDRKIKGNNGLVLPARLQSDDAAHYGIGIVRAIGPLLRNPGGVEIDFGVRVGQVVLYEQHQCQRYGFDLARDGNTMLLRQDYVVAVLEDVEVSQA